MAHTVVKARLALRISASRRYVWQVDWLASAGECGVACDAFLLHKIEQCELCVNIFVTADRQGQGN